jgi:hypothetical protein
MATVVLSSTLTQYTQQRSQLEISGKTLFGVVLKMIQEYPALRPHLFDINGELTKTMNYYLNEDDIPEKHWQNVPVRRDDVFSILLAGGIKIRGKQKTLCPQIIPMRNESRDRLKLVKA